MLVLGKLKSIFSGTNGDTKVTTRELVRKQLQRSENLRDFHLDNISVTGLDGKKEPYFEAKSSEVHKNFLLAEEKLSGFFSKDADEGHAKDNLTEDTDMESNWTDAISQELPVDKAKDQKTE